jgi:hypothetical protein
MRFTTSLKLGVLVASALAIPTPATAQVEQRIDFARGSSSRVINGTVYGRQYVDYLVNVRAGQQLSVSMTSNHRAAYFNLLAPGQGNAAYYVGSNSNPVNRFDGVAPARGLQRIRVYLFRSFGRRADVANFQLYVSVSGRPGWGTNPIFPGPAYPGPGQGFRPGGTIQCIIPGANFDQCVASVQHLGPGMAYVQVRQPNGIVRTITYQNGTAISIDSGPPGGSFVASRRGQDTVVQVGNETYVIPDMLLYAR